MTTTDTRHEALQALEALNVAICEEAGAGHGAATTHAALVAYDVVMARRAEEVRAALKACADAGQRSAFIDGMGFALYQATTCPRQPAASAETHKAIAEAFVRRLQSDEGLTVGQLALIARLNRHPRYKDTGSCATHDFCDANMPMGAAFEEVIGREPDVAEQADCDIWNAAWGIATGLIDVAGAAFDAIHAERFTADGWEVEQTGGGCTTWAKVLPDGRYMWVTDHDGGTHFPLTGWTLGIYERDACEDGCTFDFDCDAEGTSALFAKAAEWTACDFTKSHPDFPPSTMPQIPAAWQDASWKNDTCPSYLAKEQASTADTIGWQVRVYIDYADADQREIGEASRFSAHIFTDAPGGGDGATFDTDDWAEMLAYVAAFPEAPEPKQAEPAARAEEAKPLRFDLTFVVENDAFLTASGDVQAAVLATVLRGIAARIERAEDMAGSIRDENGNTIGSYALRR